MIFWELFYTFFLIGLFTFGGGYAMIPLIQDQVISKGWLDATNLANFIAISEVTPGPFAINIATFIGSNVAGIFGSVCATIGVILPSFIIILLIAIILKRFLNNRFVKAGLNGIKPIALSLIVSTTIILFIKLIFFNNNAIGSTYNFDRASFVLLILLAGYMLIYKIKNKKSVHPIALILMSAILGIIIFI